MKILDNVRNYCVRHDCETCNFAAACQDLTREIGEVDDGETVREINYGAWPSTRESAIVWASRSGMVGKEYKSGNEYN